MILTEHTGTISQRSKVHIDAHLRCRTSEIVGNSMAVAGWYVTFQKMSKRVPIFESR